MRIERGPFLVCHLLLVVTAILWFPLGCRDSVGTSSILPALRPQLQVSPTGAVATAGHAGDRRHAPATALVPFTLAAAIAIDRAAATLRPATVDHALPSQLLAAGLRSRAPPLAA